MNRMKVMISPCLRVRNLIVPICLWLHLLCSFAASAGQSGDFGYDVTTNATITITNYTGSGGSVTIPATIEGLPVKSLGDNAFYGCTGLTEVVIGNTVTNIGGRTFYGCTGLLAGNIPNSVVNLGGYAFYGCTGLKEVHLGNGVTSILDYTFYRCLALENVTIGESVTNIGLCAFFRCAGLTNVTFPQNLVSIGDSAFDTCTNLANLSLPNHLTTIGMMAFSGDTSLATLTLPNSLLSIGDVAFDSCSSLSTVTLSTNLPTLGNYSFARCSNLTSITIPMSVTNIGNDPFHECASLTNITVDRNNSIYLSQDGIVFNRDGNVLVLYPTGIAGKYRIPDGVTGIDKNAFSGSIGLTEVSIHQDVTNIGQFAFMYCTALTNISVDINNPYYSSKDGILFNNDQSILLQYLYARTGSYTMPNTVTNIANSAFAYCNQLTNVIVSSNLAVISRYAFSYCKNLKTLILPASLNSIEAWAFESCDNLMDLYFKGTPPKLEPIGLGFENAAFYNDHFLTIYYPFNADRMSWIFYGGCITVGWNWEEAPICFYGKLSPTSIIITNSISDAYKITIPGTIDGLTVVSIGNQGLSGCTNMTSLTLPDTITTIGESALSGNAKLNYISIGTNVNIIANSAFKGCRGLTSVTLPSSLTNIGASAFYGCSGLTDMVLPDSVVTIGDSAFMGDSRMDTFTMGTNVTTIGDNTFNGCGRLNSLTLPNSLANIGAFAFRDCGLLSIMNIPAGVTNIGIGAFYGCQFLWKITVDAANPFFTAISGVLYNRDQSVLICYPPLTDGMTYNIPYGLTKIADYAFSGSTWLRTIFLPTSLASLGDHAFSDCRYLSMNFKGDAPFLEGESVFSNDSYISIYYLSDASGWESTFGGIPTLKTSVYDYLIITEKSIAITKYYGLRPNVSVPEQIDGRVVASIGENAFANCSPLTNIFLPASLTNIANTAFLNCTGLTSISLPSSLVGLGLTAFDGCTGITNIEVENINPYFSSKDGILFNKDETVLILCPKGKAGNYTIPTTVTNIGAYAFRQCIQLTNTILPISLASIDTGAFQYCSGLSSLTLPYRLNSIGNYAFSSCDNLEALYCLGNSPDFLGYMITAWSYKLTVYCLPGTTGWSWQFGESPMKYWLQDLPFTYHVIDSSGISIYRYTGDSASVTVPETINGSSVSYIEDKAFSGCAGVTNIVLADTITSLGKNLFAGCADLIHVHLGSGLTNVNIAAFSGCPSITKITVASDNPAYSDNDGVLLNKDQNRLVWYPFGKGGDYQVPNSVTNIDHDAFANCASLNNVDLPTNLISIGDNAFLGCIGLSHLDLDDRLTSLGHSAFAGCTSLTNIVFGTNLNSIGDSCFSECNHLINLLLPKNLTSIGSGAFNKCTLLSNVVLSDSLTSLGDSAFEKCTSLTNIVFGTNLATIENGTFSGCTNIASVILPDKLKSIGDNGFSSCASLTNISFGENLTTIGSGAFSGCVKITRIVLPNSVARIMSGAFSDCASLQSVILPQSLTAIEDSVFSGCVKLTQIKLPESVQSISYYSFSGCSSLTSLTLPKKLTSIGIYGFNYCTGLTAIYFEGAPPSIGYQAFNGINQLTIYYQMGTTGWDTTFAGWPTAIWYPFLYEPLSPSTVRITKCLSTERSIRMQDSIDGMTITSIGSGAFADCLGLTNLTLPNSVTRLENRAFQGCSQLTSLFLSTNLSYIGDLAFEGCSGLATIALPETVTEIGKGAFFGCSRLASLALGGNVTNVGDLLCYGCSGLKNITVESDNLAYSSQGGVLMDKAQKKLIQYPPGRVGTYRITEGLNAVATGAFASCPGLSSVQLPSSVNSIGDAAFMACPGLTNISVDAANTNYCAVDGVLFNQAKTELIQYPGGKPGSFLFADSVTNINLGALAGCPGLTNLAAGSQNPSFSSMDGVLYDKAQLNLLQYPAGKSGAYSISSGVTNIGKYAFLGASGITRCVLPSSVLSLSDGAFADCAQLTEIDAEGNAPILLSDSVFSGTSHAVIFYPLGALGWGATYGGCPTVVQSAPAALNYRILSPTAAAIFKFTGSNEDFTLPETIDGLAVVSIDDRAFAGCPSLTNVFIPAGITNIGLAAFSECSALSNISVDKDNAFYSDLNGVLFNSVQSVLIQFPGGRAGHYSLPSSVRSITDHAFSGCAGITTIALTNRLDSIGDFAFSGCTGLGGLYFSTNAPVLKGPSVFEQANQSIVYYRAAANGWDSTFGGRPAQIWQTNNDFSFWWLNETNIAITAYLGSAANVTVPATIDWMTVVGCANIGNAGRSTIINLTLPDSLTSIGGRAFYGCANLTNVNLGEGMQIIGDSAFYRCPKLAAVRLPNRVGTIENSAFYNCTALQRVFIGSGLTNLGNFVFNGCTALTNIWVDTNNAVFCDIDGVLFDKGQTTLMQYPLGKTGEYHVPASATTIGGFAFSGGAELTSITVPKSVSSIGANAFASCAKLESLVFEGDAPTSLGNYAFYNDSSTTVYYLPGAKGWGSDFGGRPTAVLKPTYSQWANTSGLATKFPNACGEQDDADRDGMTNLQEMNAGTDPTDAKARLAFEGVARPGDLSDEDKTPVAANQFALYFQSAPGKTYEVQSCATLNGSWTTVATVSAASAQKRVVLPRPTGNAFYRVMVRP